MLVTKFRRITRPRFATPKNSVFSYYLGTNTKPNRGLCVWTMVFEQFWTRLVFVLWLNTIFGFKYRASTWPRLQAFKIRLKNKSRVGTPIRQNLLVTDLMWQITSVGITFFGPICFHSLEGYHISFFLN